MCAGMSKPYWPRWVRRTRSHTNTASGSLLSPLSAADLRDLLVFKSGQLLELAEELGEGRLVDEV